MTMYGTDKPDLRNPIKATDVTELFRGSEFAVFAQAVEAGAVVRAIRAPGAAERSRSFFDKTVALAESLGLGGLAYIVADRDAEGPARRNICPTSGASSSSRRVGVERGDAVFFASGHAKGLMRPVDGLGIIWRASSVCSRPNAYRFCWVTDFPFYERDRGDESDRLQPQPVLDAAGRARRAQQRGSAVAQGFQYDIVCNGVELSSGGDPESPAGHHAARVRDRRLRAGGGRGAVRRHAERVPLSARRRTEASRRASTAS